MHEQAASFEAYVREQTGIRSSAAMVEPAGINRSTYWQQANKTQIPPETVIKVCLYHGINVTNGLRAAGYLSDADVTTAASDLALESVPDSVLLEHLLHRAATREQDDHNDTGPSNSPSTPLAPVTGLHTDPLPYAATHNPEHCMDRVQDEGDI